MTGIALGWTSATTLLGSVVKNPNRSVVVSPSFAFLTEVQLEIEPIYLRGFECARGLILKVVCFEQFCVPPLDMYDLRHMTRGERWDN